MMISDKSKGSQKRLVPVFRSATMSECGLVCLVMVANYFGHNLDVNGARQFISVSSAGANLKGIMQLALQLDLLPKALKVGLDSVCELSAPAILHWDNVHFVVFVGMRGKRFIVHDPNHGRLILSKNTFASHFSGVALEFQRTSDFKPITARSNVRVSSLWSRLVGWKSSVAFALILSVVLQLTTLLVPFQLQILVDWGLQGHNGSLLRGIAFAFGSLALFQFSVAVLREWTMLLLGSQMVYQVLINLFRHLIRLPASFFEQRHVGDILGRMSATKTIQDALAQGLLSALIDGSMIFIAAIIMVLMSPLLSSITIGISLIVFTLSLITYPLARRKTEDMLSVSATEQSHLMESLRAASTIKMMGAECQREIKWSTLLKASVDGNLKLASFQSIIALFQQLVLSLQTVIIIYVGGTIIIYGKDLTLGMLISFLSFRQIFSTGLQNMTVKGMQVGMLRLYLERLSDIISCRPEYSVESITPPQAFGGLSLRNVSFRYGSTDSWVLKSVDLEIGPRDFLAVVGATGGGKSTLLKLITGMQVPTEGEVYLGGQLANGNVWRGWRQGVGLVAQADSLLSGSLAENIAFFDTEINFERVVQAAKSACIHEDILNMPMRYQTLVGDMGSSLSGGQRQRILLARALYREPKVLILDEGTANLDPETEVKIADMIGNIDITRIVVAHRPALIERAHKVIKIEAGRLVQIR